ncbi:MAG TPA: ferritin [Phycisphaerae bacterium]|nr:ferritin [Phycisphaerae bacterium]
MISKTMNAAINEQINAEMYSAYLYLAMSAHFEAENLTGIARWLRVQAKEEMEHAMKFFDHVLERGGKVTLKKIDGPETAWPSPLAAFEAVAEHERKVTGLINGLVDKAAAENDHASSIFLQWFVTEQVEEEANADAIVQRLTMIGDSKNGLFMMDHRLGERSDD